MLAYIGRRLLMMIPTLFAVSLVSFIIIQLPPGDFLTTYVATLAAEGETVDADVIARLEARYGLNQPVYVQYYKWITNILFKGDFGYSWDWGRPVSDLIGQRLVLTFVLSLSTMLFIWAVAFPVGIYSAVRQYSAGDYFFTFISFLGRSTPNFLLALVLMWIAFSYFDMSVGGLFSSELEEAPWSWTKIKDLLAHIWIPMVVLGTDGTAGLIRIMRANLLDELHKPYVLTARSKGLSEGKLLLKYPVRAALNPFVSTLGWQLPGLVSGSSIIAIVLNLPTTGPLLLKALRAQDMYLAGSFIFILSTLTVIGTLISDLLLAWLDPRIKLGQR
ncbi:MAG: ABC transporter permease [Anaerolineae bacterium]|nr:ABC transporter permease [Anaerolineae bacterium]